jgi:hypothetical protein
MKKIKKWCVGLAAVAVLILSSSYLSKVKAGTCTGTASNRYCVTYPWGDDCTTTQTSSTHCESAVTGT